MTSYTYSTLDDPSATTLNNPPGSGTYAYGINDEGEIVGTYINWDQAVNGLKNYGFLYSNGQYTTLSDGYGTVASGINGDGQIVGSANGSELSPAYGFFWSDHHYTTLLHDNVTYAYGINNKDQIVGVYYGTYHGVSGGHGFVYSNGHYKTLDDPHATGGTIATGINYKGEIVGTYVDNGREESFLYQRGHYTTLDDPLGTKGTYVSGINDRGQIVGSYVDNSGVDHGFVYRNGHYKTLDNPLGTEGTHVYGIDDAGQIVGAYVDSDGVDHGFLAQPQTTEEVNATAVTATANLATLEPIAAGATVEIPSASSAAVMFSGSTGTLILDDPAGFSGTVAGLSGQDTIDLRDIHFSAREIPTYDGTSSGGTLTVTNGIHSAHITLSGDYLGARFVASGDGHGGTSVIESPMPAHHQMI
jgi:probable HAF family extracellular repeat protein